MQNQHSRLSVILITALLAASLAALLWVRLSAETGELVLVDTSDRSVRAAFAEKAAEEEAALLRFQGDSPR